MKLKTTMWSVKNIKHTKAISSIIHAAVAMIVLIGNSSFTSISIGQGLENSKLEMQALRSVGDEISKVKITRPSKDMIKMADREMHMNMNSLIREMNSFRIASFTNSQTDDLVNDQFYAQFIIAHDISLFSVNDQLINDLFYAENINLMNEINLLNADYQIFKDFYLNGYLNTNTSLLTEADNTICSCFYTENE